MNNDGELMQVEANATTLLEVASTSGTPSKKRLRSSDTSTEDDLDEGFVRKTFFIIKASLFEKLFVWFRIVPFVLNRTQTAVRIV